MREFYLELGEENESMIVLWIRDSETLDLIRVAIVKSHNFQDPNYGWLKEQLRAMFEVYNAKQFLSDNDSNAE